MDFFSNTVFGFSVAWCSLCGLISLGIVLGQRFTIIRLQEKQQLLLEQQDDDRKHFNTITTELLGRVALLEGRRVYKPARSQRN